MAVQGKDYLSKELLAAYLSGLWSDAHIECIMILLKHGASVTGKAQDKKTPLHVAALWNHVDVINLLLAAKADPNAQNEKGALLRRSTCIDHVFYTAAHISGNTPLHEAAKKNHLGAVKALVAGGANPEVKNLEDQTPVDVASKSLIKKQMIKH